MKFQVIFCTPSLYSSDSLTFSFTLKSLEYEEFAELNSDSQIYNSFFSYGSIDTYTFSVKSDMWTLSETKRLLNELEKFLSSRTEATYFMVLKFEFWGGKTPQDAPEWLSDYQAMTLMKAPHVL
jgi:hypothetical protein